MTVEGERMMDVLLDRCADAMLAPYKIKAPV